MSKNLDGQDLTREQLADVYAAGTSDGIMRTKDGLIRIDQEGNIHELNRDEQES